MSVADIVSVGGNLCNFERMILAQIGWLLGVGDRHLDNILFDKLTAELVHIDYNVVFERGRQLRVPEIVPFRLTQSLQVFPLPPFRPCQELHWVAFVLLNAWVPFA